MSTNRFRKGSWWPMNPKPDGDIPAPAPPQTLTRVRHEVIAPIRSAGYRVMRQFRRQGLLHYECIGDYAKRADAMMCAMREQGSAIVKDSNGKTVLNNYQPIEEVA